MKYGRAVAASSTHASDSSRGYGSLKPDTHSGSASASASSESATDAARKERETEAEQGLRALAKIAPFCALHVVWALPFADSVAVNLLRNRLAAGQQQRLFDIQSWDCRNGQVNAVLTPEAPLEEIVALIWSTGHEPAGLWMEERPDNDASAGRRR